MGEEDLNLRKLRDQIIENKHFYSRLDGKNVALLCGNTGGGKSTTGDLLMGCVIIEQQSDDPHMESILEVKGDPPFPIGHTSEAKTKSISAHYCEEYKLWICDTPGFDDPRGLEVDIANAVAMALAISRCAGIRILLLCRLGSISEKRGHYLEQQLKLLERFIKNLDTHIDSIRVLFTHTGHHKYGEAYKTLKMLIQDKKLATDKPMVYNLVQKLLEDIKKHQEILYIRPTEASTRGPLLELIGQTMPLSPEAAVGCPIPANALNALIHSCRLLQYDTEEKLQKGDFGGVEDGMSVLKVIMEEVKERYLREIYGELINKIEKTIDNAVTTLRNDLEIADATAVKKGLDALKSVKKLGDHIPAELVECYKQRKCELVAFIERSLEVLKVALQARSFILTRKQLSVLQSFCALKDHLAPKRQELYETAKIETEKCVTAQSQEIISILDKLRKFNSGSEDDITNLVSQLDQSLATFQDVGSLDLHIDGKITGLYTTHKGALTEILSNSDQASRVLLQQAADLKEDFSSHLAQKLRRHFLLIKACRSSGELHNHIPGEVGQYHAALEILTTICESFTQAVNKHLAASEYAMAASVLFRLSLIGTAEPGYGESKFRVTWNGLISVMRININGLLRELRIRCERKVLWTQTNCNGILASVGAVNSALELDPFFGLPSVVATKGAINEESEPGQQMQSPLDGDPDRSVDSNEHCLSLPRYEAALASANPIKATITLAMSRLTTKVECLFTRANQVRIKGEFDQLCNCIQAIRAATVLSSYLPQLKTGYATLLEQVAQQLLDLQAELTCNLGPDILEHRVMVHLTKLKSFEPIFQAIEGCQHVCEVKDMFEKKGELVSNESFQRSLQKCAVDTRNSAVTKVEAILNELSLRATSVIEKKEVKIVDIDEKREAKLEEIVEIIRSSFDRLESLQVLDQFLDRKAAHISAQCKAKCKGYLLKIDERLLKAIHPGMRGDTVEQIEKDLNLLRLLSPFVNDPEFVNTCNERRSYFRGIQAKIRDTLPQKLKMRQFKAVLEIVKTVSVEDMTATLETIADYFDTQVQTLRTATEEIENRLQVLSNVVEVFELAFEQGISTLSLSPSFTQFKNKASSELEKFVSDHHYRFLQYLNYEQFTAAVKGLNEIGLWVARFPPLKLQPLYIELAEKFVGHLNQLQSRVENYLDQEFFENVFRIQTNLQECKDQVRDFRCGVFNVTISAVPQNRQVEPNLVPLTDSTLFTLQYKKVTDIISLYAEDQKLSIERFLEAKNPDDALAVISLLQLLLHSQVTMKGKSAVETWVKKRMMDVEALAKAPIDLGDPKALVERISKSRIADQRALLETIDIQAKAELQQVKSQVFDQNRPLCIDDVEMISYVWSILQKAIKQFPDADPFGSFSRKHFKEPLQRQVSLLRRKVQELTQSIICARDSSPPNWDIVQSLHLVFEKVHQTLGSYFDKEIKLFVPMTEMKASMANLVKEQSEITEEIRELDFAKSVPFERLAFLLQALKKNGTIRTADKTAITYGEAIEILLSKIRAIGPQFEKYVKEDGFHNAAILFDNVRTIDAVVDHHQLYAQLLSTRKAFVELSKYKVEVLTRECMELLSVQKHDLLEPKLVQWSKLQNAFSHVHEVFSTSFNPVVEKFNNEEKRKVSAFKERQRVTQEDLADEIIRLKTISSNLSHLDIQKTIAALIDHLLSYYLKKPGFSFHELGSILQRLGPLGEEVVKESPQFLALLAQEINHAAASKPYKTTIDELKVLGLEVQEKKVPAKSEGKAEKDVLEEQERESLGLEKKYLSEDSRAALARAYELFDSVYKKGYVKDGKEVPSLLAKYLMGTASDGSDIQNLVNETKRVVAPHKGKVVEWKQVHRILPQLIAHVAAVWTVLTSRSVMVETNILGYCMMPTPVQVLTLFRLLDMEAGDGKESSIRTKLRAVSQAATQAAGQAVAVVGQALVSSITVSKKPSKPLKNHFVQVSTGQGKSIVLGLLSAILALLGFRVSCACYSSYLSDRDYNSFRGLFDVLGVTPHIEYSTLSDLASKYINEQGDIRQGTLDALVQKTVKVNDTKMSTRRILLIDEADVFLARLFYGETYTPAAIIKNAEVFALALYIWKNRSAKPRIDLLTQLPEYKALLLKYDVKIHPIIDSALIQMCLSVDNFNEPAYSLTILNGTKVIGYKEHGTVHPKLTHGYKTVFAYFNEFDRKNISEETLKNFVGLQINCGQFSYAEVPKEFDCILGVTGTLETLGSFEVGIMKRDYKIENTTISPSIYEVPKALSRPKISVARTKSEYFTNLKGDIMKAREEGPRPVLMFFEDEPKMKEFALNETCRDLNVHVVTESDNMDFCIRRATTLGAISFFPKIFGRGLDFVCRDDKVSQIGGVHVIQAFLSEEKSEEVQIKGRTGRKNQPGTYSLILLLADLKKFDITNPDELAIPEDIKLYRYLDKKRMTYFENISQNRAGIIARSAQLHAKSIQYRQELFSPSRDMLKLIDYLLKQNPIPKSATRTAILCDASGSMESIYVKAKEVAQEMIHRMRIIGKADLEFMWIAYRDYCNVPIVEKSEWTRDALVLKEFMDKVKCIPNNDYEEAVEVGLQAVNDLKEPCNLVILIADAPPHSELKGERLEVYNHVMTTDYMLECKRLAEKGIKVICFYLNEAADLKQSFEKIASATKGQAYSLQSDLNLLDSFCETVIMETRGAVGVAEYRSLYSHKAYI